MKDDIVPVWRVFKAHFERVYDELMHFKHTVLVQWMLINSKLH